jgi:hypothetical protein
MNEIGTEEANAEALRRICEGEPVLVDIRPALDVVPGMTPETVLTSGAPLEWAEYGEGQRNAIIGGVLFEGLARDADDAASRIESGEIGVATCHEHDCVGSVAGIFTASMPVFVVENRTFGNRAFCNFYEGPSHRRLNYGVYDAGVGENLRFVHGVIAGVLADAVREAGEVPLGTIMKRALHMGDELHSRNTAATLLFIRELVPQLLKVARADEPSVLTTLDWLKESDYFFLRLSMASAKAVVNAAHGVRGSSVVTSMVLSSRGYAIRVSGLGEVWFPGPHCTVEAKLFEGYTVEDITWMGGESQHAETVGLGGFAQAAAFPLQAYQGGSPEAMIRNNLAMYEITVGENTRYQIPYFGYRGTPTGIDVLKVAETGITPVIDAGIAGRDGGQIGAGTVRAPLEPFRAAADEYRRQYAQPGQALTT